MKRTFIALAAIGLLASSCSAEGEAPAPSPSASADSYRETVALLREPLDRCEELSAESCANEIARVRNGLGAAVDSARTASTDQAQSFGAAAQRVYFEIDDWLLECGAQPAEAQCISSRPTVESLDPLAESVN